MNRVISIKAFQKNVLTKQIKTNSLFPNELKDIKEII